MHLYPCKTSLSHRMPLPTLIIKGFGLSAMAAPTFPPVWFAGLITGKRALCQPLSYLVCYKSLRCSMPLAMRIALYQPEIAGNVGAILRSATAFAADGLVTTARHSPQESGVLAKAASGALEHVPQIEVRNLADALESLSRKGFKTIGLDSEGESTFEDCLDADRIAIVLGAEGKGLRQKTRATCDALARLEMPGAIRSLNVSNAAAVALYATRRRLG